MTKTYVCRINVLGPAGEIVQIKKVQVEAPSHAVARAQAWAIADDWSRRNIGTGRAHVASAEPMRNPEREGVYA